MPLSPQGLAVYCTIGIEVCGRPKAVVSLSGSSWLSRQVSILDLFTWLATFLACLFIGIDVGLAIGVGIALLSLFGRAAFADAQPVALVPGTKGEYESAADIALYSGQIGRPNCWALIKRFLCFKG